jgi:hypothetical protein
MVVLPANKIFPAEFLEFPPEMTPFRPQIFPSRVLRALVAEAFFRSAKKIRKPLDNSAVPLQTRA